MLDIIEIDGASNNGVENVRDLIEKARFEPSQGKYKIYIIDEVHMLSTGAFNALLKTLEEPPPHVKFILATTEIEKVPETIRSRSLRFDFRKITEPDIVKRLEYVVDTEKITAEKEALQIIAQAARGAMRDALTLLEQHTVSGIVSTEYVRSSLSLLEESMIHEIIESLANGDSARIREIIIILASRHIQVRALFDQLLYALRDQMVAHIDDGGFALYSGIMRVIEDAYTRVRAIPDGMLLIEVTLLRAVVRKEDWGGRSKKGEEKTEMKQEKNIETIVTQPREKIEIQVPEEKIESTKNHPEKPSEEIVSTTTIPFSYASLLAELKNTKPALMTDLKNARYELQDMTLILIFAKKWNYDRVNTPKEINTILEALSIRFPGEWTVRCELDMGGVWVDMSEWVF
jgi:DNA polymerase III gamma/tau subunit